MGVVGLSMCITLYLLICTCKTCRLNLLSYSWHHLSISGAIYGGSGGVVGLGEKAMDSGNVRLVGFSLFIRFWYNSYSLV